MSQPAYYSIIPASVRYDSDLTANAKLLYGEITALSNQSGYCWASNKYFANLYDVSVESIKRYIRQLKESGYIRVEVITRGDTTERHIYVLDDPGSKMTPPRVKNDPTPRVKNDPTPRVKNDPLNNTSMNTTSNKDIVGKVISYLNAKTAQSYRPTTKSTERHITARINDGFALEDFYAVIDAQNDQWGNDEKMRRYLRPETLFGTKMESYIQAAKSPKRLAMDDEGWL